MILILVFFSVAWPPDVAAQQAAGFDWQARALSAVNVLDYIAVDYPAAVQDGAIIHAGEFAEQAELAATVERILKDLPLRSQQGDLLERAAILADLVGVRADADTVSDHCRQLAASLVRAYDLNTAPDVTPDLSAAATLFTEQCAGCHGSTGRGDGPAGADLDPPPTDFLNEDRAYRRSLYSLYATISFGVQDTGMASFAHLSPGERWALAFYVAGLGDEASTIAQGKRLWEQGILNQEVPTLARLAARTPRELGAPGDETASALAYLRHHPEVLEQYAPGPIERAKQELQNARLAYGNNQPELALQSSLTAYLDGFERIESLLGTLNSDLSAGIEHDMQTLRNLIRDRASEAAVSDATAALVRKLGIAADLISHRGSLPATLFVSALLIFLREGLEAILIVVSMGLYLRRTAQPDSLRYLHFGWATALAAGMLTWLGIKTIVDISGVQREVIEGVAAMAAALVLLYVGIWMHSKDRAALWQASLHEHLGRSLSRGARWGIAGLPFVAVYREMLEVGLFYESLWLQSGQARPLVLGVVTAGLGLVVLGWLVVRVGTRLPLRQFFRFNGLLIFLLAIVFAGKGVTALQEAGWLAVTYINAPKIDWLGLSPTTQSLGIQSFILAIGASLLYSGSRQRPNSQAAGM